MADPPMVGPFLVVGAIVLLFVLVIAMSRAASRGAALASQELGLEPDASGWAGVVDGVSMRVLPNHMLPHAEQAPARAGLPIATSTGETLLLAAAPRELPFPWWLESTVPGGRGPRSGRILTGDTDLDAAFSLLTAHPRASAFVLSTPGLRSALLEVRAKLCCLLELDAFQVALHGGHHGRTVELARDAARIAREVAAAVRHLEVAGPVVALPCVDLEARITSCRPLPEVRSGSALLRSGGQLLVVQDDHEAAALVDPVTGRVSGERRRSGPIAKAGKPDWEAAFAAEDGTLYFLGSGSTAQRCRVEEQGVDGRRGAVDARALYAGLARVLGGAPNVEGAVRFGDRVRLFHHGSGPRSSATVDVGIAAFRGGEVELGTPRSYDLGTIDGVALHFTDAAIGSDGRVVYLAAAEDAPDAVADGPVLGAALGVIEDGLARWTLVRESDGEPSRRKFEGIVLDQDGGWLVTDPDDPDTPASLCRFELGGPS